MKGGESNSWKEHVRASYHFYRRFLVVFNAGLDNIRILYISFNLNNLQYRILDFISYFTLGGRTGWRSNSVLNVFRDVFTISFALVLSAGTLV